MRATQFRAALRDRHDEPLGFINQFFGATAFRVKTCGCDILCCANQLSKQRALPYSPSIGTDVGGSGRLLDEICEVGMATSRIQFARCQQAICNGDDVNRFVTINQNGDLTENRPVLRPIKVAGINQLGNHVPALGYQ